MKFKVDENLPVEVAEVLRTVGHDAMTVREQGLDGESDPRIMSVWRDEKRALITLDLDFSDIRAYPSHELPGVIVIRVPRQDKRTVLHIIRKTIPLLEKEQLAGFLWIVSGDRVRIR
jgi:predicted nuclease of predicted toxin-antitoxin system